MHQPGLVGDSESAEHGPQHCDDGMRGHRAPFAKQFAQGSALDEFHDQERVCGIISLVVDGHQAGMFQARDCPGLAMEAVEELLVAGVAGVHHLQGNRPVEANVESPIDRRHPAGGNPGLNAVSAVEQRTDERIRPHRMILSRRVVDGR